MRLLLDTHVFLWMLGEPERFPEGIRRDLTNRRNELRVSAASAMEVATKVRIGKLDTARHLVNTWSERTHDLGVEELAISTAHALLAGSINWDHRDPFDRLLVSQALIENLTLVTTDPAMRAVTGLRTVTW